MISISIITEVELLSFPGMTKQEESRIKAFIRECSVIELTEEVKNICIDIRRSYSMKVPDSIIAASAIYAELPLVIADKHFKKVKELEMLYYAQ